MFRKLVGCLLADAFDLMQHGGGQYETVVGGSNRALEPNAMDSL
jgi:hypothetical protein